jgi:hypothetical protein
MNHGSHITQTPSSFKNKKMTEDYLKTNQRHLPGAFFPLLFQERRTIEK